MYVPFENLPGESRIWIYQSNRKFSDEEFAEIETALQAFLQDWAAHGTGLESGYQLKYNRFIIIAVNQDKFMMTLGLFDTRNGDLHIGKQIRIA